MDLVQKPESVTWPKTHFIFVEKIGPFQENAPEAWRNLHELIPAISARNKITGHLSLFKPDPKKMTYRAGVGVAVKPTELPKGASYTFFDGGRYCCFVLTGPYSDLPQACGRVFEIVAEKKIRLRDDFCIEHYVNDPKTTPEVELITQILVPAV